MYGTFKVVCVCGDRGGSARGNHGRRKISARGKIWAVSDEEGTLWTSEARGGKGRSSGGGRRWTTSQSLGLVNGCRMSMKKIGKRRGSIRRGLVTARTSYFLPYLLHLTYICPDVDILPFFHSDCDFGEWDIPRGNTDIPA